MGRSCSSNCIVVSYLSQNPSGVASQVIPFLVLAVGVDNMFILAHALQQQDEALPVPERLGRALASAGPSFGLGGFTSMPAVRNFSLCAAVAVLLDYVLQVGQAWICSLSACLAVCFRITKMTLCCIAASEAPDVRCWYSSCICCMLPLQHTSSLPSPTYFLLCSVADTRLCCSPGPGSPEAAL